MSDAIIIRRGGSGGVDTSDATMVSTNLENGYTGYANGIKVTGSLQALGGIDVGNAGTITSNASNVILSGNNLSKTILNASAPISIRAALSSFGNATEDDVTYGKTFTSSAGFKKTGNSTNNSELVHEGTGLSGIIASTGDVNITSVDLTLSQINFVPITDVEYYIKKNSSTEFQGFARTSVNGTTFHVFMTCAYDNFVVNVADLEFYRINTPY